MSIMMNSLKNQIIIRPIANLRGGLDFAFKTMAEKDDDVLIHGTETISHSWGEEEWQYYLATN